MKILMIGPAHSVHTLKPLNLLLKAGHEVIFMDIMNPYPEGLEGYQFIPYAFADGHHAIFALQAIQQRMKPDVIHVHWIDQRAYECVKAGLKPLVFSAWGSDINEHFNTYCEWTHAITDKRFIGECLRGADAIIVDAEDISAKCARLAGCPLKTELLTLGVDTNVYRPGYENEREIWRSKLNIQEDAFLFLAVRSLQPFQNHHLILEAFAKALPNFLKDSCLLLKSYQSFDSGEYEKKMHDLSISLGINDHIRWVDTVSSEAMPVLYALADVIVNFPSIDAFPVSFIEAAACEKPVITNRLPAYGKTFADRFFYFFEPSDIENLSVAMTKQVNSPTEGEKASLAEARNVVIACHSSDVYLQKLMTVYNRLTQALH